MRAIKIYMNQHQDKLPYSFCYYAKGNVCDGFNCLLGKCYHDMTMSEMNRLKEQWKKKGLYPT